MKTNIMKTNRFVLGFVAALFTSTAALQVQACGLRIGFSLPFFSFGIGLGIGAPCAWPACGYGYPHPASAYYCQAANALPPLADAPSAPVVADPPPWVPATPGPGHWVPDPKPYVPAPAGVAKRAPESSPSLAQNTATVIRSPGGVPVYIVTQLTAGVGQER
jgi:hypothetical protein